jgi:hypothetical protein
MEIVRFDDIEKAEIEGQFADVTATIVTATISGGEGKQGPHRRTIR